MHHYRVSSSNEICLSYWVSPSKNDAWSLYSLEEEKKKRKEKKRKESNDFF